MPLLDFTTYTPTQRAAALRDVRSSGLREIIRSGGAPAFGSFTTLTFPGFPVLQSPTLRRLGLDGEISDQDSSQIFYELKASGNKPISPEMVEDALKDHLKDQLGETEEVLSKVDKKFGTVCQNCGKALSGVKKTKGFRGGKVNPTEREFVTAKSAMEAAGIAFEVLS
ncbi:hypothetical protein P7C70_g5320, partial [Phenoliferia sp. Uapishka_3]